MTSRIIDKTLSCLDDLPHDKTDLSKFLNFLIEMEVDSIELSEKMHRLLSPLPEYHYAKSGNAKALTTALAVELIMSGKESEVATTFCGIGGFAPTEEVIMALRLKGFRKPNKTYPFLPEMANLFSKITGKKIRSDKPIIGERIFYVESGVHVDGILKLSECYEPFAPEIVGLKRKIVLGKKSGTASIRAKLLELNVECGDECIPLILERVKAKSLENNGEVSDAEFAEIASRYHA
jgi:homocitrate synthase NifV